MFSKKRILLRNLPKLNGAVLVGAVTRMLSLGFSHVRFAPSVVPSSVAKAVLLRPSRTNERAFDFRGKPVFTGVVLTSRVGETAPGARDTLLRTVKRGAIAVVNRAGGVRGPFFMLTARGPVSVRKACPLPRTRASQFLYGIGIICPAGRRLGRVTEEAAKSRGVRLGGTTKLGSIVTLRRLSERVLLSSRVLSCTI